MPAATSPDLHLIFQRTINPHAAEPTRRRQRRQDTHALYYRGTGYSNEQWQSSEGVMGE